MIVRHDNDFYGIYFSNHHWEAMNVRNYQRFTRMFDHFWLDMHGSPIQHDDLITLLEQAISSHQQRLDKQHKPRPITRKPTYAPRHLRKPQTVRRGRGEGNRTQ